MEQQLADRANPAFEAITPKPKGKKSRWLLVGGGLILLAFLSNGKQPANGTSPSPKALPPKTKPKKFRMLTVIYAVAAAIPGIWLSVAAGSSPGGAALVNAITGVFIAIIAVLLYAEEVSEKVKPVVLQVVGLGLGFFALAQAFIALFRFVLPN